MDFLPTFDDPDVYLRRARKSNSEGYCELLLLYLGDVLCRSDNTKLIIDSLVLTYDLKDRSVVLPNIYLGY